MRLIDCTEHEHAATILAILNHAIVHTTALYDYKPRSPESIRSWFEAKRSGGYPVLGAMDERGELVGFASYGPFRAWPAYKYTVEHSIYVHHERRSRGIGTQLLQ